MKIFLFGPSGSGKSTIISWLNGPLQYEVLSIDQYRSVHCDYTWPGMDRCNKIFTDDILQDNTHQIVECSGIGKLGDMVRHKIYQINDDIHVIIVTSNPQVCISRNRTKAWYSMKLPYKPASDINAMLKDHSKYRALLAYYNRYHTITLMNNNQYDLIEIKSQLAAQFH